MEIDDIQKKKAELIIRVNLKITKEDSRFLRNYKISPTKLFRMAISDMKVKLEPSQGNTSK